MTAPLSIAVTSLYLPGSSKIGTGYQVHQYANRLVDRGHSVTVLSPDEPGEGARYDYRHVDPGNSHRTFRFAWRLRERDLEGFDVLHAHGDDHFLIGTRRPPHVRTVHGSCFAEALRVRGVKARTRMALLGAGEVVSSLVADKAYGVSYATKRVYPWLDGVIPNGVDVPPVMTRTPSDEPSILFVGTYENRKRGRLLVEQFVSVVRPKMPAAKLWMVCSDAPSQPGVEVLGRIDDNELRWRYQSAWVFCLPSSYEGFGIPYVEAMANGCPVVATPNPGALEVLDRGRCGLIVEPANLGRELTELLVDESRRLAMAQIGYERSGAFRWEQVISAYEGVFADLLGRAT